MKISLFFLFGVLLVFTACSPATETLNTVNSLATPPDSSRSTQPEPSGVNAGEIDDNLQWNQYLDYRNSYLQRERDTVRDVNISERQIITVTDSQGLPVLGARVLVYSGQTLITESRTYATGETLFFPEAWLTQSTQPYRVVVERDNAAVEFALDPQTSTIWNVQLDADPQQQSTQLDILFLLDSTGSMSDEIAQLQNNLLRISAQISQLPGNVDVRYGLVTYRDRGEAYVTQSYDFVADVNDFQSRLSAVRAAGGGDTPEALNEALHVAVQNESWRGENTIKLIFLVADAAPHLDYANDYDYAQEMAAAAWQGIKIHPLASSGLTRDGEFIFRQLAQYTMGHFLFLTYQNGNSGAAGTERTDLAVGESSYGVEQLDDLVLRRITDEIAALTMPVSRQGLSPQLKSVALRPVNPVPASFALAQTPAFVPPQQVPARTEPLILIQVTQSQLLILVIVAGYVIVAYWLGANNRVEKRKRKNEELIIEATD